jgi:hypothetical protein
MHVGIYIINISIIVNIMYIVYIMYRIYSKYYERFTNAILQKLLHNSFIYSSFDI